MSDDNLVWSDTHGDLRKKKSVSIEKSVNLSSVELSLRRLTSGKGRTVIEISNLPNNKKWCQQLAKSLKKKLGVGGTFKDGYIELHGEKIEKVMDYLSSQSIKYKKTGG